MLAGTALDAFLASRGVAADARRLGFEVYRWLIPDPTKLRPWPRFRLAAVCISPTTASILLRPATNSSPAAFYARWVWMAWNRIMILRGASNLRLPSRALLTAFYAFADEVILSPSVFCTVLNSSELKGLSFQSMNVCWRSMKNLRSSPFSANE